MSEKTSTAENHAFRKSKNRDHRIRTVVLVQGHRDGRHLSSPTPAANFPDIWTPAPDILKKKKKKILSPRKNLKNTPLASHLPQPRSPRSISLLPQVTGGWVPSSLLSPRPWSLSLQPPLPQSWGSDRDTRIRAFHLHPQTQKFQLACRPLPPPTPPRTQESRPPGPRNLPVLAVGGDEGRSPEPLPPHTSGQTGPAGLVESRRDFHSIPSFPSLPPGSGITGSDSG